VVLFDPETVMDQASFEDAHQLSTGIRDVWVNGTHVIKMGKHSGATPGRMLRM
jgi:N-acyl-D-aspartate/D-glutamate deacylase